jgi:hypothetical protein
MVYIPYLCFSHKTFKMKANIGFFLLFATIICSCSKDENNEQNLYIKSICRQYDTLEYSYSAGKVFRKQEIMQASPGFEHSWNYLYTAGRMDSIIRNDGLTFVYYYSNDTLVRIQSRGSDWTTILFKYDASYRVSEQQTSYLIHGYHGESYLEDYLFRFKYRNGNIDTCVEYGRPSTSSEFVPYDTITYTYDDKKNPFSVITDPDIVFYPYNLPRDFRYYNQNNLLEEKHSNPYFYIFEATYQYTYNTDNYPTSRAQTNYYGTSSEYYNY